MKNKTKKWSFCWGSTRRLLLPSFLCSFALSPTLCFFFFFIFVSFRFSPTAGCCRPLYLSFSSLFFFFFVSFLPLVLLPCFYCFTNLHLGLQWGHDHVCCGGKKWHAIRQFGQVSWSCGLAGLLLAGLLALRACWACWLAGLLASGPYWRPFFYFPLLPFASSFYFIKTPT
jgi:hypothetical protein